MLIFNGGFWRGLARYTRNIHEICTDYKRFRTEFWKKTLPYHYDSALYEIYCCLYNVGSARLSHLRKKSVAEFEVFHVLTHHVCLTRTILIYYVVKFAVHAARVSDVGFTPVGALSAFLVLKLFLCKHNQMFL